MELLLTVNGHVKNWVRDQRPSERSGIRRWRPRFDHQSSISPLGLHRESDEGVLQLNISQFLVAYLLERLPLSFLGRHSHTRSDGCMNRNLPRLQKTPSILCSLFLGRSLGGMAEFRICHSLRLTLQENYDTVTATLSTALPASAPS